MKTAILGSICWLAGGPCWGAEAGRDVLSAKPAAIKAWKDMRFGMFIRWGVIDVEAVVPIFGLSPSV